MFDSESGKETEQKRSYLLMGLGAVGALVLAVVVIFLSSRSPRPQQASPSQAVPGGLQIKLEDAVRPGSPEFDGYKDKVVLENIEVLASSNMLGMTRFEYKGRLHNRGDRPLTGVELTGDVYSLEDKLIAQNTNLPIPRARTEPLKPGESMRVNVVVDTPSNIREGDVREVKAHVSGLRFQ
jgi:hypothetical protein